MVSTNSCNRATEPQVATEAVEESSGNGDVAVSRGDDLGGNSEASHDTSVQVEAVVEELDASRELSEENSDSSYVETQPNGMEKELPEKVADESTEYVLKSPHAENAGEGTEEEDGRVEVENEEGSADMLDGATPIPVTMQQYSASGDETAADTEDVIENGYINADKKDETARLFNCKSDFV